MLARLLLHWLSNNLSLGHLVLFAAVLALLGYAFLVLATVVGWLPDAFADEFAIAVHGVTRETVWDHILDVQKNPLTASQRVRTTILSANTSWQEEIGSTEVINFTTTESQQGTKLMHAWHADAVALDGTIVLLLEVEQQQGQEKGSSSGSTTTIVRIFVTVRAPFQSALTPLTRLVLHCRPRIIPQVAAEYCQGLCRDMAVPYEPV